MGDVRDASKASDVRNVSLGSDVVMCDVSDV